MWPHHHQRAHQRETPPQLIIKTTGPTYWGYHNQTVYMSIFFFYQRPKIQTGLQLKTEFPFLNLNNLQKYQNIFRCRIFKRQPLALLGGNFSFHFVFDQFWPWVTLKGQSQVHLDLNPYSFKKEYRYGLCSLLNTNRKSYKVRPDASDLNLSDLERFLKVKTVN